MKREFLLRIRVGGLGLAAVIAGLALYFTKGVTPSVSLESHRSPVVELDARKRVGAAVAASAKPDDWSVRWSRCQEGELTPGRVKAMAALLKALAAVDPRRALAWAEAAGDVDVRTALLDAVLRGWSAMDAGAAETWASGRPDDTRWICLQGVIAGLATVNPDAAAVLVARCSAHDPGQRGDFGRSLVDALAERGDFAAAARFAGSDPEHPEWRDLAFFTWARQQPQQALAEAQAMVDPEQRAQAMRSVRQGWAQLEPVALVNYAMSLPAGEERAESVTAALPQWVSRDPVAASTWVASLESVPEFDEGAAIIAAAPGLVAQQPSAAFKWAASISHDELRSALLTAVAGEWVSADASAVRRFLETAGDLSAEETAALRTALSSPVRDASDAGSTPAAK